MKYSIILVFIVVVAVRSKMINTDQNQAVSVGLSKVDAFNNGSMQMTDYTENDQRLGNQKINRPPKNSVTDTILNKLKISSCGPNEVSDADGCICSLGFHKVPPSTTCSPCTATDPNLVGNEQGGCMCKDEYGLVKGICTDCRSLKNFIWNLQQLCICDDEFVLNNDQCKKCQDIDSNSVYDGDEGCRCKSTYIMHEQKCKSCDQIDPNSVAGVVDSCECLNGYKKDSEGVCVLCSTALPLSEGDDNEGCICLPGLVLNSASSACVCPNKAQFYNTSKSQCQSCQSNYYPLNNQCTQCPRNAKQLPPSCKFSAHLSTLGLLLLATLVMSFI